MYTAEAYMARALSLAENGWGRTNPNPLVGCVLVKKGKIVGEGWHKEWGGPHAEVNALKSAGKNAAGADVYLTLEPCSHYGKTPPCADALVRAGVKKVFIAMTDPNPLVAGKGAAILKKAGIEVVTGILEKESRRLNEIFIRFITAGRPFVHYKTAVTLDGKCGTVSGESRWISCEESRNIVHRWRARCSAVMAGIGTVLKDDPLLTVRCPGFEDKKVLRVIADSAGKISEDSRLVKTAGEFPLLIAATDRISREKELFLEGKGIGIVKCPDNGNGQIRLAYLMEYLGARGVDSVFLEGGGTLAWSALSEGIISRVSFFIAPKIVGGKESPGPVGGPGLSVLADAWKIRDWECSRSGDDFLLTGLL